MGKRNLVSIKHSWLDKFTIISTTKVMQRDSFKTTYKVFYIYLLSLSSLFLNNCFSKMSASSSKKAVQTKPRMKASTGTRSDNKLEKPRVYLQHACFICGNLMSNAKPTINHIDTIHGFNVPTRAIGRKRPQDNEFEYIRNMQMEHDVIHYACPSCWFHCPDDELEALNKHTREEHDPIQVDISKNGDLATVQRPRSRSNSVSSNRRSQTPTAAELNETRQIAQRLDELTDLFTKFFKG